jgi:hypothetical protein
MADNLSVSVTADTSSLRAQLALAQADLRAFSAETRKLATDIRSGGDAAGVLRGQLERVAGQFTAAKSNVVSLTGALREGKAAHEEHAHGIEAVNNQLVGMLSPLTAARSGLVEFAEIAGVAFAFEKIAEVVKEMTELGEKTEIMAAAVGVTPAQFSALSAAMQIAGADADGTSRVLERLGKRRRGDTQPGLEHRRCVPPAGHQRGGAEGAFQRSPWDDASVGRALGRLSGQPTEDRGDARGRRPRHG